MRRLISLVSIVVALVALGLVLYNATLVDRRGPGIARVFLSAPAGDERLAQTLTAIDIQFSELVRTSSVEGRFRIEPYVAGAFAWDGPTAIFTPSAKLPPDTEFTIRIEAGFEDLVGNVAEIGLEPWVFRTVGPPVVVRAAPIDGTTGVSLDGVVDLDFDRLMDTASVESAIRLDPPVALRASWSGETVRLTFDSQLRFGMTYTLTVGVSAADTGGNRLRDPFMLHFSTVAAGLAILDTVPREAASGIGIRSQIAIRFDAPIDPDRAREAFRMTPSVAGEIRIVAIEDDRTPLDGSAATAEPDTLLFVPDDPLAAHTTYSVTLESTVARRDDPEAVAAGRSWSFTTGSPSTSGQNQVAFLAARSGVRNVWLMNPDGTNPRQLTTALVPVSGFDATFDGALVAYSAGGIVSVLRIAGNDDEQRITDEGHVEYAPAFTPDDRWLIVGRRAVDGSDLGYWLVPLPGTPGEERLLVDHGAPPLGSADLGGDGIGGTDGTPGWMTRTAIDPTGAWALVVTAGGEPNVIDLALPSLAAPSIPIPLLVDASPAWSSRHRTFVVSAVAAPGGANPGTTALWMVAPDGRFAVIPGTDGAVGPVGVGPDGSIAVTLRRPGEASAGIGVLASGAPSMTRHAPSPAFDDRWPAFSPDGGEILIGRTFVVRPQDADGIWSVGLSTGVAKQLTTDGAYARWLP